MNLQDRIKDKKVKVMSEKIEFHKKLNSFTLCKEQDKPFTLHFPNTIDISRLIKGREVAYAERWTTSKQDDQCTEQFMRSSIHPPFRDLFYQVWNIIRLFKSDKKELWSDAAGMIVNDLKILHKITTELAEELSDGKRKT